MNTQTQVDALAKYPLVEALVMELRADTKGITTTDAAIRYLKNHFDMVGPFHLARRFGLLVNNSGEEFACQFMSFWNEYTNTNAY